MRIQNKLFLSLLLSSIAAVAILVVLMQWSISHGMVDYVNKREMDKLQPLISDIAIQYSQNKDWKWLENKPRVLRLLMSDNLLLRVRERQCDHDDKGCHTFKQRKRRPDIALIDELGKVIVSVNSRAKDRVQLPIDWQGKTIAWLSIPHHKNITEGFELVFLDQQRKAFYLMSLIVMMLAGIIAFPLARHFVRPIQKLTQGANQLTQGNYAIQLPVNRNDELGLLARDFNELARTLEQNESSRKRWVADISHELRTPLSILSGEIEAMLDGVRAMSKEGIHSMKEEVDHLSKLVNDLYELTKADIGGLSYRKEELDLVNLVQNKLNAYHALFSEHKLTVSFEEGIKPIKIWADSTRLNQLLDNLLTNTCRYTNEGGQVDVSIQHDRDYVTLHIEDSAPSVPDEALAQLFDYLYRTEQSRNRESGGSGLGLAICKRIVEGHDGTLTASHSAMGGLAIQVQLPVQHIS